MSRTVAMRGTSASSKDEAVTVGALWRWAQATLGTAGVEPAEREAAWLLEAVLGCRRLDLVVSPQAPVPGPTLARARALVARRAAREPLQYLLGTQEFCGLDLVVTPEVLIPRPETALLVEEVTRRYRPADRPAIADLGTGSGCIAITLARALPQATIYAVDQSEAALAIARLNATRHGVQARIRFLRGDWFEAIRSWRRRESLDAIVSNPPYIASAGLASLQPEVRYEPSLALDGGADGLGAVRSLVDQGADWLVPGGVLAVEVGAGQASAVRKLAAALAVYDPIVTRQDDAGIERVVCMTRRGGR